MEIWEFFVVVETENIEATGWGLCWLVVIRHVRRLYPSAFVRFVSQQKHTHVHTKTLVSSSSDGLQGRQLHRLDRETGSKEAEWEIQIEEEKRNEKLCVKKWEFSKGSLFVTVINECLKQKT